MHHRFNQKTVIGISYVNGGPATTSAQKGDPGVHLQTAELAIGMAGVTVVRQYRANSPFEELNLFRGLLGVPQHSHSRHAKTELDQTHRSPHWLRSYSLC